MFHQPKEVYYLCPLCRLVYKERRIIGTLGAGPSCPKCGTSASNDARVFPRQVRVRCPKPLCGLVQSIAVPIEQDIAAVPCSQCGTHLCPEENAYPRLPVRILKAASSLAWRGMKAVGRGLHLAVVSPWTALRWTALAPFRAVAAAGRFLFDLPFRAAERYLTLKVKGALAELEAVEALRRKNEPIPLPPPPPEFVPQSFPAVQVPLDGLPIGAKTTVSYEKQNIMCEVIRHETFYDEIEVGSSCNGPGWRLFQSRGYRPWTQTHFEGDMMLVSDWHLTVLKRVWIEVMPSSKITDKNARMFLDSATLEINIRCCRAVLGILSHFYRREIHAEGIVVPGGRNFEARIDGGFGTLSENEKLVLRVSIDGVVMKPLGTIR